LYASKAATMSAAFLGAFHPRHLQMTRGGSAWHLTHAIHRFFSPFTSKKRLCSMLLVTPEGGYWSARMFLIVRG
jgi:hypothetical protein